MIAHAILKTGKKAPLVRRAGTANPSAGTRAKGPRPPGRSERSGHVDDLLAWNPGSGPDQPKTWEHAGGGCMLIGGHPMPCDDSYVNRDTGELVEFRTTPQAHFSMPEAVNDLAEIDALEGVQRVT